MLSYVKTHESLLLEHVYFGGPLDFKMDLFLVLDSNLQTLELYVSTLTP